MPTLQVKLDGTAPFAKVYVVKDGKYVYTSEPKTAKVDFTWQDMAAESGKMSYYYVRGEQAERRNRLGLADVDHLHGQVIIEQAFRTAAAS